LRGAACGFEQLKKAVKANSIPAIRCKIKTVHFKFSIKQFGSSLTPQMQRPACSFWSPSASGRQDGMRQKNCKSKKGSKIDHDKNKAARSFRTASRCGFFAAWFQASTGPHRRV
jgi:hypothetical protein